MEFYFTTDPDEFKDIMLKFKLLIPPPKSGGINVGLAIADLVIFSI
jgi:hypothetical protein